MLPPLVLLVPAWMWPDSGWPARFEAALRRSLELGGPCLIKLGQWASTRPDVLPRSLCHALGQLHDRCPAHALAHTHAAIADEFGEPSDLFRSIAPTAIGSGCVAQVHEARLRRPDGARVAIKVLHPGVEASVAADLWLLHAAAATAQALLPLRGMRWLSLPEAVETFSHFMREQLDLSREAANLERFALNFGPGGEAAVRFPAPHRPLVSRRVLVESYLEGETLSSVLRREEAEAAAGLVTPPRAAALAARNAVLARRGLRAFLEMVLRHNFVHADLHPGNVMVVGAGVESSCEGGGGEGGEGGSATELQMGFVDAGLTVELAEPDRLNFLRLFKAIGNGEGELAAELMLRNAREHECDEPASFRAGMRDLVGRARAGQRGAFNLAHLQIGEVLLEVTDLVRTHRVKVEPNFTTLVMAIVVLEGLGRQLDPKLDLFSVALPLLADVALLERRS